MTNIEGKVDMKENTNKENHGDKDKSSFELNTNNQKEQNDSKSNSNTANILNSDYKIFKSNKKEPAQNPNNIFP